MDMRVELGSARELLLPQLSLIFFSILPCGLQLDGVSWIIDLMSMNGVVGSRRLISM